MCDILFWLPVHYTSVFQPLCCSRTLDKWWNCSEKPMWWVRDCV